MRMLADPSYNHLLMTFSQVVVCRATPAALHTANQFDRFLVSDPSISREHALVEVTDDGTVTVTDIGSRNGVTQVRADCNHELDIGVKCVVENKDVFYFGSCPVLFILEGSSSAHAEDAAMPVERVLCAEASAVDSLAIPALSAPCSSVPMTSQGAASDGDVAVLQSTHVSPANADCADVGSLSPPEFTDDQPGYIQQCTSSSKGVDKYLQQKLHQERLQKWARRAIILSNFASVLLASVPTLSVPQECGRLGERRTCTIEENIDWYSTLSKNCNYNAPAGVKIADADRDCFTHFNQFVLCWNALLVLCFAVLHVLESRREAWLGKYLDSEPSELRDNLVHTKFWALRGHECAAITQRLFHMYSLTLAVFILNVVFSGLMVLPSRDNAIESVLRYNNGQGGYYLDYRTATTFYAFVWPLLIKLVNGAYLLSRIRVDAPFFIRIFGRQVLELQPLPWGLSTVKFEPCAFNVVAPEVCLKEANATDEFINSWQHRNPNGWRCPHVPAIPNDARCHCTLHSSPGEDSAQRGFLPLLLQQLHR